jgi:hypothetical protein
MAMREIPRNEWATFLDSFNRQHHGWLNVVELLDSNIGEQVESLDRPLLDITADLKDEDKGVILILVGRGPDDQVTHLINAPTQIWIKETEEGAHQALHIESKEGTTTVLRFRSPILPELVDGIVLDR